MESYNSFHSDLALHVRSATEHVYSNDDTVDSDNRFINRYKMHSDQVSSPNDTLASERISDLGDVTVSCEDSDSVSKLHETHFGDSISDIPRTVIHSPVVQDSLANIPRSFLLTPHTHHQSPVTSLPPTGNTIFDCELGCFISVEEYERKCRQKYNH